MDGTDTGWRAKLDRAVEVLPQVQDAIAKFIDSRPYEVSHEKDGQTGRFFANAVLTQEPPQRLSVMVGEVMHDQRSSLALLINHLISKVSISNRSTEFPICDTPTSFYRVLKNGKLDSNCGLAKIRALDKGIQDIVEQLQPYKDPSNPLWVLHNLNNQDKHRDLIVVGTPLNTMLIHSVSLTDGHRYVLPGWNPAVEGPLHVGSIVARVDYGYDYPDISMTRKLEVGLTVVFNQLGPASGRPVVPLLHNINEFIRNRVFTVLEPFA